jgi:DNA gyrase/topoisomerase IV subunit A
MAELTKKLQLTDQQQKQIAPLVVQRDKKAEVLEADKSMGKLQKLKQAVQLQKDFKNDAAKYLNADQVKKLEALQEERRAKLTKVNRRPSSPLKDPQDMVLTGNGLLRELLITRQIFGYQILPGWLMNLLQKRPIDRFA